MANDRRFGVSINLEQNELKNAVMHKLASAPLSPVEGQEYYNTTDKEFYVYDGAQWLPSTHTPLTVNAGSTDYLDITNHEISVKALLRHDKIIDETYSDLNAYIVGTGYDGSQLQLGDELYLANASNGNKVYWRNSGTAGDSTDFTLVKDELTQAEVRGYFTSGEGTNFDATDGSFDALHDHTTINVNGSNELYVIDGGINTTQLADDGVTASKINVDVAGDGLVQNVSGALDVNVDSTLQITGDAVGLKAYKETIGDGVTTDFTITHNFNTKDCIVQVYDMSTGEKFEVADLRNNVNSIEIQFASAPASNAYRVLVLAI